METTMNQDAIPEEIEEGWTPASEERHWTDFDDDGQLIIGRDTEGSWY